MNNNNQDAVISIITDNNNHKWVRVEALGEDFCIATEDLNSRDDMTYDEAMKELKEVGLDTFNRKQGFIIAIYIETINAKLKEAGGKEFERDWYTSNELWKPVGCADYYGINSWFFYGNDGCFINYTRYFGNFRCRPVLAYASLKF